MSRRVWLFQNWRDRKFQRTFKKLRAAEQAELLAKLADLAKDLATVSHPVVHPVIRQKYRSEAYEGVITLKGSKLVEYRLGRVVRVIAKYPARPDSDDVLLVAVTLDHDHDRLKALLRQYRSEIQDWNEEEAVAENNPD